MEIWQMALLVVVGIVAGWVNVMAGGGSMLTVPAMVLMGLPGPVANGTNRIAILAQNVTAVSTFFRGGFSDFRLSMSLAIATLPGAIAGAWVGTELDGPWFNRILALIMIAMLVLMLVQRNRPAHGPRDQPTQRRLVLGHLCMVGAGFWGGFIQIGVGFILMPILHRVIGLDLVKVNMHKVFIVLVYTIAALAVFSSRLQLSWMLGLALALGNSVGGWLGAHTSITRGDRLIRMVFNLVIALLIIKLLLF